MGYGKQEARNETFSNRAHLFPYKPCLLSTCSGLKNDDKYSIHADTFTRVQYVPLKRNLLGLTFCTSPATKHLSARGNKEFIYSNSSVMHTWNDALCLCILLRGNWISYINRISGAFEVDREGYYFSLELSVHFIAQHGVMKLKIAEWSCAVSTLICLCCFGNSLPVQTCEAHLVLTYMTGNTEKTTENKRAIT